MIKSRFVPSAALGGGTPSARIRAAFNTLADAWLDIGGIPPSQALYSVLAVAGLESSYGNVATHNWGSIQCGHGPPCGDDCVELGDTHADGSGYKWCYRRYNTARDGALDLARLLIRRVGMETLSAGNMTSLARAMKEARYYELAEEKYAAHLEARYRDVLSAMGAPPPPRSEGGSGWLVVLIGALGAAWVASRRRHG